MYDVVITKMPLDQDFETYVVICALCDCWILSLY